MIVSIEPLTQCYMPKLKIIHLRKNLTNFLEGNELQTIEPLERCKFPLL